MAVVRTVDSRGLRPLKFQSPVSLSFWPRRRSVFGVNRTLTPSSLSDTDEFPCCLLLSHNSPLRPFSQPLDCLVYFQTGCSSDATNISGIWFENESENSVHHHVRCLSNLLFYPHWVSFKSHHLSKLFLNVNHSTHHSQLCETLSMSVSVPIGPLWLLACHTSVISFIFSHCMR